ncbi:DUF1573 domain-containing protein [Singulisphaera acidiphila]|uniref:DUF1573 domain-containing protein n=1 Tax=Singulisphaera acidiphila (strain ATCC BAA-1392 / DSM 18658 / VKM B-2454 / MOB10) TaxID=886293 RepID=L0DSM8_SINAD|nr:DUF1573 domain-containing protein [Singulisphaera acidiphila]AGA31366.1 Protein of unknown function (DUF1573) [Singulisphaera acidiphila DSM 18658]
MNAGQAIISATNFSDIKNFARQYGFLVFLLVGCRGGNVDDLSFDRLHADLGDMTVGSTKSAKFIFKNNSQSDIVIQEIERSCGCIIADDLRNTTVKKGDTCEFQAGISTSNVVPPLNIQKSLNVVVRSVSIGCSASPSTRTFGLTLAARVCPQLLVTSTAIRLEREAKTGNLVGRSQVKRGLVDVSLFKETAVESQSDYHTSVNFINDDLMDVRISIGSSEELLIATYRPISLAVGGSTDRTIIEVIPPVADDEILVIPRSLFVSVDSSTSAGKKPFVKKKVLFKTNNQALGRAAYKIKRVDVDTDLIAAEIVDQPYPAIGLLEISMANVPIQSVSKRNIVVHLVSDTTNTLEKEKIINIPVHFLYY